MLCVELDASDQAKDEAVRSLLRSHGYQLNGNRMGFNNSNEIWTPNQMMSKPHGAAAAAQLEGAVAQAVLDYG